MFGGRLWRIVHNFKRLFIIISHTKIFHKGVADNKDIVNNVFVKKDLHPPSRARPYFITFFRSPNNSPFECLSGIYCDIKVGKKM